jgi:hypothetical protein
VKIVLALRLFGVFEFSTVLRKLVAFLNAEVRQGNAEVRRVFPSLIYYGLMKRCS